MQRVPEPELMDDPAQALAYAQADFSEPHDALVRRFRECFSSHLPRRVIDLGCGPADVTLRFARAYPTARLLGVDGAGAMLDLARRATDQARLDDRVRFVRARLPELALDEPPFDTLISNSLLHHLPEPAVLWQSVQRWGAPGAVVYVVDLMRPSSTAHALDLAARYAADAPAVLQRDFYNSLLAAFTPEEIQAQLRQAGLALAVEVLSDRHVAIHGRLAP